MTTGLTVSITDELIAELEQECRTGADDHGGMGHEEESALFDRIGDVLLALMAERKQLRWALWQISLQVDGNIRPTIRDIINGMPDANDIYDYCDNIQSIINSVTEATP